MPLVKTIADDLPSADFRTNTVPEATFVFVVYEPRGKVELPTWNEKGIRALIGGSAYREAAASKVAAKL